jgi:regulator of protease activity HflC (stomatin/prohibitin superfamily)
MTTPIPESETTYIGPQLTQARVPLTEAGDALMTRDSTGRIPIVIVPQRLSRVRTELIIAAVVAAIGGLILSQTTGNALWLLGLPLGLILMIVGVSQAFVVRIPEGANALLLRGGRYYKTLPSGTHFLLPYIFVSHLVTRREIPFDVPSFHSVTKDSVQATLDTMVTFSIADAYKFVYTISADDFDQVFLAICQDALRGLTRDVVWDEIVDLRQHGTELLAAAISKDVSTYGVKISKVTVTYAGPPPDFLRAQEMQQLAVLQRREQAEKHQLALQKLADDEALAQARVVARVNRKKELLQVKLQAAEMRKRLVELEAEAEELRLRRLQERLEEYPTAAKWEWETAQLEVAEALATNTRAVVQMNNAMDLARTFVTADILQDLNGANKVAEKE